MLRPLMSHSPDRALAKLPPPAPGRAGSKSAMADADGDDIGDFTLPPLTGEIDDGEFDLPNLSVVSDFSSGDGGGRLGGSSADPVERLRNLIGERQEETVEILRSWLEDREENV